MNHEKVYELILLHISIHNGNDMGFVSTTVHDEKNPKDIDADNKKENDLIFLDTDMKINIVDARYEHDVECNSNINHKSDLNYVSIECYINNPNEIIYKKLYRKIIITSLWNVKIEHVYPFIYKSPFLFILYHYIPIRFDFLTMLNTLKFDEEKLIFQQFLHVLAFDFSMDPKPIPSFNC